MADEEVARVQGPVEAEVIRALLASYGIPARMVSRVPHSVMPFTVDGLGEVRIRVAVEHAAAARAELASHRQAGLILVPKDD